MLVDYLGALHDLTDVEAETLDAVRAAAWRADWGAARDVALGVARAAAWSTARGTALAAAWDAAWDAAGVAALDVARDAALGAALGAVRALVVADLVGQHGLTRDHLDALTAPARVVPRLSTIIDRALPTKEH